MPVRYFKYDQPFALENGEKLPELTIAYHTFGTFKGNNAVWVCHALTANSDVADWWAAYGRTGPVSRPEALFHRLREHHRLALRIDRSVEHRSRDREAVLRHIPLHHGTRLVNAHFLLADHLASHRLTPSSAVRSADSRPSKWR